MEGFKERFGQVKATGKENYLYRRMRGGCEHDKAALVKVRKSHCSTHDARWQKRGKGFYLAGQRGNAMVLEG